MNSVKINHRNHMDKPSGGLYLVLGTILITLVWVLKLKPTTQNNEVLNERLEHPNKVPVHYQPIMDARPWRAVSASCSASVKAHQHDTDWELLSTLTTVDLDEA